MLHIIDICLEVYTRNLIYSRTNFTNSVLQLQLLVGELGRSPPPTNQKIGLSPPHFPLQLRPKNVDFSIFMQFMAILLKMSLHNLPMMGNPAT